MTFCIEPKNIDVVILCGGMGTRLREETEIKPKPMVEVGGKPILWHIMKYYSHYGFNRFILALGYKGEYIKNYFFNYRVLANDFTIKLDPAASPEVHSFSDEIHWEITCIDTGCDTLKGGRIKMIEPYVKSDYFYLTYGDGVSNIDLSALDMFHHSHGAVGTVSTVRPPSRFGEVVIEGDVVKKFIEKPQLDRGYINGGFFVFKKEIFNYLTADKDCDFEFGALERLASDGELRCFKHDGFWQCMDNVRDRDYLNRLWELKRADWKVW